MNSPLQSKAAKMHDHATSDQSFLPSLSTHLDVLAVEPADDLDLIWSPCLMSAPFGEMENERRRYIMASVSPPAR